MARTRDEGKIEAIYEATLDLVLKTGFNGLKMADVAKAARLATGTVYIYFKNKDVLINQLFLHVKGEKTAKFMAAFNPAEPFELSFKTLWFRYLDLSLQEPERMLFIEQFAHTSYLTKKTKSEGDAMLEPLTRFLQRGIDERKLRNLPVSLLISQLLGPIYEMVKLEKEGSQKLTTSQKQSLFEMAWNSVKQ
jgi:AcrR family transcriptional regulator